MDYVTEDDYADATAKQFINDMEERGLEAEHYRGRFYWEGPAVRVEDMGDLRRALAATSVVCQWDNMGMGFILYPRRSSKLAEKAAG